MDPYLETPAYWPDVHNSLITALREQIQPNLSPNYLAIITPHVLYESLEVATPRAIVPDIAVSRIGHAEDQAEGDVAVAIAPPADATLVLPFAFPTRYHRIEIRTVAGERLVTVIELLSPANKRPGEEGADVYDRKRRDLTQSRIHLVEIDLLRAGTRPRLFGERPDAPYYVTVSRSLFYPRANLWPISLRAKIPVVPVPLEPPDADVPLDIGAALARIYDGARYDLRVDYRQPPPAPDLSSEDAEWLNERLVQAGKR
jgi:hypothetical protein